MKTRIIQIDPRELKLLKLNARFMRHEEYQRLTAKYNAAGLDVGVHKVKVSEVSTGVKAKAKTGKITVKKASTTFLNEVDAIYIKKAKTYNIALFNKNNDRVIKGIKLHVKIYDGKKC